MASTFVESRLVRLRVEIRSSVARVVLNNPPLNVIDIPMMEELARTLAEIEARSDISVVVLSGEGKAFSVGVDVAAHTPDKVEAMLLKFHGVIRALVASRKVTVAAVHGHCLGGGAELAMVCDMVVFDRLGAVGISGDQAGMLSAGGVHGAGCAGGAEAGRGVDSDGADDQRDRGRGDGAGESRCC